MTEQRYKGPTLPPSPLPDRATLETDTTVGGHTARVDSNTTQGSQQMAALTIDETMAQVAGDLIEAGVPVMRTAEAMGIGQQTLDRAIKRGRDGVGAPHLVELARRVDTHAAKLTRLCELAALRFGAAESVR